MSSLGDHIDKLVERKVEDSGSGAGALIAAIRLLNRGGVVRWALRVLTKEVEFNGERKPLMEWVLAKYVGESQCPTVTHFVAPFFEMGMKLATAWLHADEEPIKQLLSDPAIRRGGIVTTLRGHSTVRRYNAAEATSPPILHSVELHKRLQPEVHALLPKRR